MRSCKFIKTNEFDAVFYELLNSKRKELEIEKSEHKLKSVWAVGDEAAQKAVEIAENVEVIYEKDAKKIAELAEEKKPEVILWTADLWGRRTAPQVADYGIVCSFEDFLKELN